MEVTVRKYDKSEVVIPCVDDVSVDSQRTLRIVIEAYDVAEKVRDIPVEEWQRVTIDK